MKYVGDHVYRIGRGNTSPSSLVLLLIKLCAGTRRTRGGQTKVRSAGADM